MAATKTKATFLGHAIHPMLVPIPLGAAPTALVFDVLLVWTGDATWQRAAAVALVVTTVGMVAAAIPGFVDYLHSVPRRGEVWKHAGVHAALGSSLTIYFALSAVLHGLASPSPAAAWAGLGMVAFGSLGLVVQGYLGGGLVEDHHLGVDTSGVRKEPSPSERFPFGGK